MQKRQTTATGRPSLISASRMLWLCGSRWTAPPQTSHVVSTVPGGRAGRRTHVRPTWRACARFVSSSTGRPKMAGSITVCTRGRRRFRSRRRAGRWGRVRAASGSTAPPPARLGPGRRKTGGGAGHERGDRVRCAVDVGAVVLAGPFALLPGPQGGAAVGPAGADQDRAGLVAWAPGVHRPAGGDGDQATGVECVG